MVVVCKPNLVKRLGLRLHPCFVPGPSSEIYIKLIEMIKLQQQAGAELCQAQDKFS